MELAHVHAEGAQVPDAAAARRLARRALRGLPPELADDVLLLVSELVTNALRHGSAPLELRLRAHAGTVSIAVRDEGPGRPERRRAAPFDPGGRGLRIVQALADSWGVDEEPGGKVVWCRISANRLARMSGRRRSAEQAAG